MKRKVWSTALAAALLVSPGCGKRGEKHPAPAPHRPFVVGIFQSVDSPTAGEVRRGILQAFEDAGLREGDGIVVRIRIAAGDIPEVQRVARQLVAEKVDMIIPLSTQSLQAALLLGRRIPIVFSSVATPFLVGAGRSATDHLGHVTGVASTGPVRQTMRFIRDCLPGARRVGTLWTPSEINSEYYLELARESAAELGFELAAIPVASGHEIPQSAQGLVNEKADVLFPISDNTINSAFDSIGRVAEENRLPLFGGFLRSVEFGACAAVGFNFQDMGYRTGQMAVRVMKGESPGRIPIQTMDDIKIFLNLDAAEKQGVRFSREILNRADRVISLPFAPASAPELNPY